jgi:hypothetical protein
MTNDRFGTLRKATRWANLSFVICHSELPARTAIDPKIGAYPEKKLKLRRPDSLNKKRRPASGGGVEGRTNENRV